MATTSEVDVRDQIVAFKRTLAPNREGLKRAFADVKDHVSRAADSILREVAAGRPVVPELDYQDIRDGKVPESVRQSIRSTGCAVIRGVFPPLLPATGSRKLGEYLETNRYEEREVEKRSLDKYFAALKAGKPQIFNVYWSRPQVMARQDARLAETRAFLDRLWKYEGVFNPDLPVHLCRPGAAAAARGQDARPFPTHGRGHRRALDRPRLSEGVRAHFRRVTGAAMTRSTPRTGCRPARFRRQRCAACSAPIRAGRR